MENTGSSLRERRIQFGLSQAKLSELSGVSQHLLSAYELEKITLTEDIIKKIARALSNTNNVDNLVTRKKRYREHHYIDVKNLPDRVAKTIKTDGNDEYTNSLKRLTDLHLSKKIEGLTALSLFSGCGGFSLGFSAAGFEIKGFVELDKDLRKIYKRNFPTSIEMGSDITGVSQEKLSEFHAKFGNVDLIIGGPPCQGFSLSGKRNIEDPRNQLFRHYLRFVDTFKPKIAVLENVRLLTSMKNADGGYVHNDISNEFHKHGYEVKYFEINAKDFGVPQHRERVLFVAVRSDLNLSPSLPNPTHGGIQDLFGALPICRTFADACSDLPFIESGQKSEIPFHEAVNHPAHVIDWLWDVPEGYSAHDNEDPNKRPPSGYNTTYKRQVWNEPASTVQTTFGMISGCRNVHPIATRSLSIREAARIQSFPDEYIFDGTLGTIRTGIGNAVPPLLAYQMAIHVKKII